MRISTRSKWVNRLETSVNGNNMSIKYVLSSKTRVSTALLIKSMSSSTAIRSLMYHSTLTMRISTSSRHTMIGQSSCLCLWWWEWEVQSITWMLTLESSALMTRSSRVRPWLLANPTFTVLSANVLAEIVAQVISRSPSTKKESLLRCRTLSWDRKLSKLIRRPTLKLWIAPNNTLERMRLTSCFRFPRESVQLWLAPW